MLSIFEYDEEAHHKLLYKEGVEGGIEQGMEHGRKPGIEQGAIRVNQLMSELLPEEMQNV